MERLREITGIAFLSSRWFIRQPLWLVQGVLAVIGMSAMMVAWDRVEALKNLIIAWIIAGAWSNGLNLVAQRIGWDKIYDEYDRLIASPVSLSVYFIGVILGNMPFFFLVNIIPAIIVSLLIGLPLKMILFALAVSPVSLYLGALTSLAVVLRLKNPTNISSITNPLNTFTVLLPPVYYSLAIVPKMLRGPLLFIPTVSLMELARWIAGLPYLVFNPVIPAMVLALWTLIITPLAFKRMKWWLE